MHLRHLLRIMLVLALATSLTGCVGVDFTFNTSTGDSSSAPGGGNASHTVNGSSNAEKEYRISAQAGQTIRISYNVATNQGSLILSVRGSGLTAKNLAFRRVASEQDVLVVPISSAGTYTLEVDMRNWGGSYTLSWTVG